MKQFNGPSKQGGWVQIALGVAQLGTTLWGGRKGKKAAKKAGDTNAFLIWQTYKENQRRKSLADQRKLSLATAATGASNIQMSGSASKYMADMQDEIDRENKWLKKKAQLDVFAAQKGAGNTASAIQYDTAGRALQQTAQIGVAAYDWWTGRN